MRNSIVAPGGISFRFVDLFAGIGGFRLALESLGGTCVASAEIMPQALEVYHRNWAADPASHNLGDVNCVSRLPEHEILVGGVPCQPWSIAGKNKAFQDPRGMLWADVIRLVRESRPVGFVFENVKGLVDPRNSACLSFLLESLASAGYQVHHKLLNAFDFGLPQNRDRVFVVGVRNDLRSTFSFPRGRECQLRLFDVFDGLPRYQSINQTKLDRDLFGERVGVGFNKLTPKNTFNEFFVLNDIRSGPTSFHSWDIQPSTQRQREICMAILRNRRKPEHGPCDGNPMSYEAIAAVVPELGLAELDELADQKILRKSSDGSFEFYNRRLSGGIGGTYRVFAPHARFFATLTARGMKDAVATVRVDGATEAEYRRCFLNDVLRPGNFRQITSREAARLQGFPEEFQLHDRDNVSKMLLGNSVAVPVVRSVAASLLQAIGSHLPGAESSQNRTGTADRSPVLTGVS